MLLDERTTPELVPPPGWELTADGMSRDGLHALDVQVGVNDAGKVEIVGDSSALGDDQRKLLAEVMAELAVDLASDKAALSFAVPEMPLAIAHKKFAGESLTPDEATTWQVYEREVEAAEHERELLGLVDLAEVMREGITEPEMLVADLLVKGEHHLWYGNKESAKTWIALWASAWVMGKKETVVWVDKEMGRRNIADRLLTLGVPADVVGEHFLYCEFPTMDCSKESITLWRALLDAKRPALVVVDAQTEVLADADLNENVGTDIEKWMKAYITPARRVGVATVMLDHTGHSESGRAVASRQKGAAAKVELSVVKHRKFDRESLGSVEVSLTKNTVSAPIPSSQHFRIGGDGEGNFTLEASELPPFPTSGEGGDESDLRLTLAERIKEAGDSGITKSNLRDMVGGRPSTVQTALDSLVNDDESHVVIKRGVRKDSLRYVWSE